MDRKAIYQNSGKMYFWLHFCWLGERLLYPLPPCKPNMSLVLITNAYYPQGGIPYYRVSGNLGHGGHGLVLKGWYYHIIKKCPGFACHWCGKPNKNLILTGAVLEAWLRIVTCPPATSWPLPVPRPMREHTTGPLGVDMEMAFWSQSELIRTLNKCHDDFFVQWIDNW
jgi:hypothetical protein